MQGFPGIFCYVLGVKVTDLVSLSPPNKLLSAKFLVCFNLQFFNNAKGGENVVRVSNRLDLGETQSYLMSHPDPSCLHMALLLCLAG